MCCICIHINHFKRSVRRTITSLFTDKKLVDAVRFKIINIIVIINNYNNASLIRFGGHTYICLSANVKMKVIPIYCTENCLKSKTF